MTLRASVTSARRYSSTSVAILARASAETPPAWRSRLSSTRRRKPFLSFFHSLRSTPVILIPPGSLPASKSLASAGIRYLAVRSPVAPKMTMRFTRNRPLSPEPLRVPKIEGVAFSRPDLLGRIPDPDLQGPAFRLDGDRQPVAFQLDVERRSAELHGEREPVEVPHRFGVEAERPVADVGPEVAALDQVQGAGHHAHVDALLGGAPLHVPDVALERHHVPLPRALRVDLREDAGEIGRAHV